jgi:hypothetical protein
VQVAEGSMFVNCSAAVITAALTALVESPLELFRHNSQAGQIQGNFLAEMWRVRDRNRWTQDWFQRRNGAAHAPHAHMMQRRGQLGCLLALQYGVCQCCALLLCVLYS